MIIILIKTQTKKGGVGTRLNVVRDDANSMNEVVD